MELMLRILTLLCVINLVPPLLTMYLGDRWQRPVDGGRRFLDGKPLFGSHKTWRGLVGAVLAGALAGGLLGFPWWEGPLVASLAMAGDLISSFIKRRMGDRESSPVPGLDQVFEGALPFLALAPHHSLSLSFVWVTVLLFSAAALVGSWFFKQVLLRGPSADYPRQVNPLVRLRELRSCGATDQSFHRILFPERYIYYQVIMKSIFRALRIYHRGTLNVSRVAMCRLEVRPRDLPRSFDGYTLLFLSDVHLDGLGDLSKNFGNS